jgi:hypothetical protein
MGRLSLLKIGAVAGLWAIIAGSALTGWWIGKGESARQISELRQRLAVSAAPRNGCGVEVELLEASGGRTAPPPNLFGVTLGGLLPRAPQHLHLREMLTSR